MPVINVRISNNSATSEQKKEVREGIKKVFQKVLNKDPDWVLVNIDEAPLSELIEIIQKAKISS